MVEAGRFWGVHSILTHTFNRVFLFSLNRLIMYISSLRIENFFFKSFYGVHDFTFSQGVNVVLGLCGEGKTSLCRAIEFGLFGGLPGIPRTPSNHQQPTSNLINVRHVEECKKENKFYDCTVARAIYLVITPETGSFFILRY